MWKTTSWTQVLSAQYGSDKAVQQLYEDYWPAIYAFLRHSNYSVEDAEDYVQSFFTTFLEKDWLQRADREKGRFRTFILTILKRFVRDQKFLRQKNFESNFVLPKESTIFSLEPSSDISPEDVFQQTWAESLLEKVIDQFRVEVISINRLVEYEVLWLMFFSGCTSLLMGDIKHPQLFFSQLQNESLFDKKLSTATSAILKKYEKGVPTIEEQKIVVQDINRIFATSAIFDQHFSQQHVQQYQLYSVDIDDFSSLLQEIVESNIAVFFPKDTLLKFEKYARIEITEKIQEYILRECNQVLTSANLPCKTVEKYPHNMQEMMDKIITNRIAFEQVLSSVVNPCFLRLNKVFLEHRYPQAIVKNIYHSENPSYAQIAEALGLYKSKVDFIKNKALQRYRHLLTMQVQRYCDDSMVEEEINGLLEILMNK